LCSSLKLNGSLPYKAASPAVRLLLSLTVIRGAGIAQWLDRLVRDQKVPGSSPRQERREKFLIQCQRFWFLFVCLLSAPPHVTAVARKRSRPFCQKCRWQVTAKHACLLRMWLFTQWRDMMHGCMVYTERAEMAAVSRGW